MREEGQEEDGERSRKCRGAQKQGWKGIRERKAEMGGGGGCASYLT